MKRLTLRERDVVSIGTSTGLTEADAAALAQLQPALPNGVFAWEHRAVRFGPFCGVLCAGNITVELLPKISDGSDTDEHARGLLVALLRATGQLSSAKIGDASLGQQRIHLLDLFILDFCNQVQSELHRGAIARYEEQNENLSVVRGRVLLTDYLRLNPFDWSRLFCSFDEHTIDNPFNRILKAVLRRLLGQGVGVQAKTTAAALLHRFNGVRDRDVTACDIDRLPFDRTSSRWESIFGQAQWLLRGLFPDVRIGDTRGACLLFNMEQLFENLLGRRVRHAWHKFEEGRYRVELQKPRRHLADSAAGKELWLRPDMTVWNEGQILSILDAKWKLLDPSQPNSGISSADAYQMTTYASRFGCGHVVMVYPASKACPPGLVTSFFLRIPTRTQLDVVAVDLRKLIFKTDVPEELNPRRLAQAGPLILS